MKIFHEAPKHVFESVQAITDGDYALCHLLEKDKAYAELFLHSDREIILDNSVFELDTHVPWAVLDTWTDRLKPDWVVLPDVLDDYAQTVVNARRYLQEFQLPQCTQTIGVVQGSSYEETVECYKALADCPGINMIAFSYNACWWKLSGDTHPAAQDLHYMVQRVLLLNRMEQEGIIRTNKPHHLLGCALPQEFRYQRRPWIYSCDTSSPVMAAINGTVFTQDGINAKPLGKLCDFIDYRCDTEEQKTILQNILTFRGWAR